MVYPDDAYFLKESILCMGYESSSLVIPDLTYKESRFKMRGLRSLVSSIIELIKNERDRGNEIVINATGGFKAEIADATLIGLLFDVPVFYIHEAFQDIIEMPPVPISWDYSLIADHDEFFDWLVADLRPTAEADARIKALPSEVRFLLTEEDGYTLLSPVGDVFFEASRMKAAALEAVPVFLSEKARRSLEAATPDERKILDKTIRKLRDPILRHNNSEQKYNSDCLAYPKGHCPERAFYYEDDNGLAHVCDLTASHDVYERMLNKGGVWRRDYGGFSEI